jgi:hypothetical protein
MKDQCTTCRTEAIDRLGFQGPNGESLCGACYFAVWGPSGAAEISRAVELLTPDDPAPNSHWGR